MAEAFAKRYGEGKFDVLSAGNKPTDAVNPVVVEAMREKGIDISTNKPELLTFQVAQDADLITTTGCNHQGICPGPFFKPTVVQKLEDPKGKPPLERSEKLEPISKDAVRNYYSTRDNVTQTFVDVENSNEVFPTKVAD